MTYHKVSVVLNKHYLKKSYLWTPSMIKYTQGRCEKCMLVQLLQTCPNLGTPMDCDPPGSFAHGNFQATVLKWLSISFSRGSSWPRDQTPAASWFFTTKPLWKPQMLYSPVKIIVSFPKHLLWESRRIS